MRFWIAAALALGLALRSYHYLSNPSVWHDEAALIINVLHKDYGEHFGPLYYSEAAPPLFMWLERFVAQTAGDGVFALRFVPWLASCLTLVLVCFIGRRLLPPMALLVLLALLACSDRLLWHACEAKPYAVDALLAVGLLAVMCRLGERPPAFWLLLSLTLAAPLFIFLSFPACFVLGGFGLAILPAVARCRRPAVWSGYGLFLLATGAAFAVLYLGPIHAQRDEQILACWSWNFPAWQQPWLVPLQLVIKLTEVFRYASEPIGNVLSVLAVMGGIWLWRQGRHEVVAFLILPTALAAFAWLLGHYPLGPSRVMAFAAPACLVLIAAGVAACAEVRLSIARCVGNATLARSASEGYPSLALRASVIGRAAHKNLPRLRVGLGVVLVAILSISIVQAGYRVGAPWKRNDSATPAAFVLNNRKADEPVVGTMWEHLYYFRCLGDNYRILRPAAKEPTTLPATACCRQPGSMAQALWLVAHHDCGAPVQIVDRLAPAGEWHIEHTREFPTMTVVFARRNASRQIRRCHAERAMEIRERKTDNHPCAIQRLNAEWEQEVGVAGTSGVMLQ